MISNGTKCTISESSDSSLLCQDLVWGQWGCPVLHRGQRRLVLSGPGLGLVQYGPDEPAGGDPGLSHYHHHGWAGQTERRQKPGLLQVHGGAGLHSTGLFATLCISLIDFMLTLASTEFVLCSVSVLDQAQTLQGVQTFKRECRWRRRWSKWLEYGTGRQRGPRQTPAPLATQTTHQEQPEELQETHSDNRGILRQ